MEHKNLNNIWAEVHTEAAARALLNPTKRRYLEPFMDQERSASEAAKLLGIKLTAMLYQLERLQALDLLQVTREQLRSGRPIKLYQATANKFFVPFEVTKAESVATLLAELEADFQRYFVQNLVWAGLELAHGWGFSIYRDEEGRVVQDLVPSNKRDETALSLLLKSDSPALWASSSFLTLDFETAKALQRDMNKLLSSYQAKQTKKEQAYLVKLGLTPLEP